MPNLVTTTIDAPVARITLNRPEARNPTSIAMLDDLDAALNAVTADEAVRVVILSGAGKSFCSGLDLKEVLADEATIRRLLTRLSEVMRRVRRLTPATIAQVHGAAIGGGFGLMAAADFRLTHPEAKLGYPPLETCLSPALMAPWLVRLIGPSRARSMLMAGGTITGAEAHERGIVSHLAARDELEGRADALAEQLAKGGRFAATAMKHLLNEIDGSLEDEMLDLAASVSATVIAHEESQGRLRELFEA